MSDCCIEAFFTSVATMGREKLLAPFVAAFASQDLARGGCASVPSKTDDDDEQQLVGPFSLLLRPEFRLSWHINTSAATIHATMGTNASGWTGFGLSPTSFLSFHGMNHADIIVASSNSSSTCTVGDYFNDGDFEGRPALDVEIGGTDDVLSHSCARADGWSTASWSRKLATGDRRDWNITHSGFLHVIIAHGASQEFGYHGSQTTGVCELDFWTGELKKPCLIFW